MARAVHVTPELNLFVAQLRSVGPKAKRAVRKAIVASTQSMRDDMAGRASWSDRIPGAIRVRVGFSTGRVDVRVSSAAAPHARPYEGSGGAGSFRHPVFGNRQVWVSEATRPFFLPAVRDHRAKVRDAVERAVLQSIPPIMR